MPKDVIRFVLRVLAFVAVVALLLLMNAWLGPPLVPGDFMAAMAVKHHRLETSPSPRVVVIGGSNAGFGIDSDELAHAFHRPVVNMALHGGLGFEFMVNESIDHLRQGDLVLVFPEHIQFSAPNVNGMPLFSAMDTYPQAIRYAPLDEQPGLLFDYALLKLSATRKALHTGRVPRDSSVYQRARFNESGDEVAHLSMRPPGLRPRGGVDLRTGFRIDPRFWTNVERLLRKARESGCTVAFGWPCFARSSDVPSVDDLLERELRAHVPLVIGEPKTYVYPDSLFFDTEYHLARDGRALRTADLLRDLRTVLPGYWFKQP